MARAREYFELSQATGACVSANHDWVLRTSKRTNCRSCGHLLPTWRKPVDIDLEEPLPCPMSLTTHGLFYVMASWVWKVLERHVDPQDIVIGRTCILDEAGNRTPYDEAVSFFAIYNRGIVRHARRGFAIYDKCRMCRRIHTTTSDGCQYFLRSELGGRDAALTTLSDIIVSSRVVRQLEAAREKAKRLKRLSIRKVAVLDELDPTDPWESLGFGRRRKRSS